MVLTEKRRYNYILEEDDIAIARLRDKYKSKSKKKLKSVSKGKCVCIIALFFFLCTMLLLQHSKVNGINMEIIEVEKELKEVQMINDSKEGVLLSSLDLVSIEKTAKEQLGMVEPTTEQYSYMAVAKTNLRADEDSDTKKEDRAMVSWINRLID